MQVVHGSAPTNHGVWRKNGRKGFQDHILRRIPAFLGFFRTLILRTLVGFFGSRALVRLGHLVYLDLF